jgi:hypothetical protein
METEGSKCRQTDVEEGREKQMATEKVTHPVASRASR